MLPQWPPMTEPEKKLSKTCQIIEDPETKDLLLDLGQDVLDFLGWQVGDVIEWIDNEDGSWTIKKTPQSQSQT